MLEQCYERQLKSRAEFRGSFDVTVEVRADGHVLSAKPSDTSGPGRLVASCIAARMMALRLPTLTEGAELVVPVLLRPKSAFGGFALAGGQG